ncbi:MAG: AMP-binding protein, partial [Cyanobacteria bacterium J06607_10]
MGTDIDATSTQPTTLVGLLQFRASYQADQVAYTFLQDGETQAKTLTYQELDRRAQVIATKLQSMDALGERALLLYPPGLDYIVAFFGCLYAGVVAVPAYPPRPNRSMVRLQSIFRDAQSKLALTTLTIMTGIEKTLEQSPDLKKLSWITTDEASDEKTSKSQTCSRQKLRVEQQSLAFLQYTSGSTAAPKGVVISHENLMHNLQLISQCFGHTP